MRAILWRLISSEVTDRVSIDPPRSGHHWMVWGSKLRHVVESCCSCARESALLRAENCTLLQDDWTGGILSSTVDLGGAVVELELNEDGGASTSAHHIHSDVICTYKQIMGFRTTRLYP